MTLRREFESDPATSSEASRKEYGIYERNFRETGETSTGHYYFIGSTKDMIPHISQNDQWRKHLRPLVLPEEFIWPDEDENFFRDTQRRLISFLQSKCKTTLVTPPPPKKKRKLEEDTNTHKIESVEHLLRELQESRSNGPVECIISSEIIEDLIESVKAECAADFHRNHEQEKVQDPVGEKLRKRFRATSLMDDVAQVANGEDLWVSDKTRLLREYAQKFILPLASSTHRVEAMVRECSHVAATNRGEESRSDFIMTRSVFQTVIGESGTEVENDIDDDQDTQANRKPRRLQGKEKAFRILDAVDCLFECATRDKARWEFTKEREAAHIKMKEMRLGQQMQVFNSQSKKKKKENKRMQETGVDRTTQSAGRVAFKCCKSSIVLTFAKNWLGEVSTPQAKENFTAVKKLLQNAKLPGDTSEGFKPLTDLFENEFRRAVAE